MVHLTDEDWRSKDIEVLDLFSPGAPIDEDALFAGRQPQISKIIETVMQRGRHVIIFGERGVGKTSLARTFSMRLASPTKSLSCVMVNCVPSDTFETLWRKVYRELSDGTNILADAITGPIEPDEVRRTLGSFGLNTIPIIILDEFDKLVSAEARGLMANTIKYMSDYSVPATLILVGVAKSVGDLVEEHESVLRALEQVKMPRMNDRELGEIITKRLDRLNMGISPAAKAQIVVLSRGLPHYTHLLGQQAARRAIAERTLMVTEQHVEDAQQECLQRVDQTIKEQYHRATHSPRGGNLYKEVLLSCALAEPDELGFFPAKAVEFPLSQVMGQPYKVAKFGQHLTKLCESDRGSILEVTGSARRFRYRFREPLMQPYVVMRGVMDKLIARDALNRIMPNSIQPRLSGEI
jgi:Cdc6-like AAA superfamily ATPase